MNCQELELKLGDLVREPAESSDLWVSANLHLEGCPHCSARVAEEQALQTRLRDLAVSLRELSAPERIESRLLQAFRAAAASRRSPRKVMFRSWMGWRPVMSGASVGLLVLLALWFRPHRIVVTPEDRAPQVLQVSPSPSAGQTGVQSGSTTVSQGSPGSSPVPETRQLVKKLPQRGSRASVQKASVISSPKRPAEAAQETAEDSEGEMVTEFMPFMAVDSISPMEQQQLVRVKLSRTVLEIFGLPVNRDGRAGPVKADVLLSEDGLVRAIRFVR